MTPSEKQKILELYQQRNNLVRVFPAVCLDVADMVGLSYEQVLAVINERWGR